MNDIEDEDFVRWEKIISIMIFIPAICRIIYPF